MKLIEILLSEDKIDFITQNQGDKVMQAYRRDRHSVGMQPYNDPKEVVQTLANASKKYLQIVVNWYVKRDFQLEDVHRIKDEIEAFERIKRNLPADKKNLAQYKSSSELYQTIQQYNNEDAISNKEKVRELKKDAKKYYEDDQILVVVPKTQDAACYYGKGTRWCTAATGAYNYFNQYNKEGPLFIIMIKGSNEKYQFHFESKSFMNSSDYSVDLDELVGKYPSIKKAFTKQGRKYNIFTLVHNPSDEDIIKHLQKNPGYIKTVNSPSPEVIKAALSSEYLSRHSLDDVELSPNQVINAIQKYPYNAAIILSGWDHPRAEKVKIAKRFLDKYPEFITFIKSPSMEEIKNAINNDPNIWYHVTTEQIKSSAKKARVITITLNKIIPYLTNVDYDTSRNDNYDYSYYDEREPVSNKDDYKSNKEINAVNIFNSILDYIGYETEYGENSSELMDIPELKKTLFKASITIINNTEDAYILKSLFQNLPKQIRNNSSIQRAFVDANTQSLKFLPKSRDLIQYANAIIDHQ